MPESRDPEGKYVYCVIQCDQAPQLASLGIGERGDPVYTVHNAELAAVVSDSPIVRYEARRRNLMAHTRVLEEVMRDFTVLPVRFGTIAPDAEVIAQKLLARRHDELVSLLREMDGRVELGLKAFWHDDALFQEIVDETPPIRALRDSLIGRSAEETHFERMRLGEMVETAMERKREKDAELILSRLRPLAHRVEILKTITERMVVNAALLVDKSVEPAMDEAVQGLDADLGHRLMFKYVGSVPPYNFVNIVVHW
ncbi:MAG: GvpL/GvpF family gas vesicle protein [Thermoleophilia bacterium]|nr:GvpL/GvpF family gas vesicle protein [Thermoleophilia bacterium]